MSHPARPPSRLIIANLLTTAGKAGAFRVPKSLLFINCPSDFGGTSEGKLSATYAFIQTIHETFGVFLLGRGSQEPSDQTDGAAQPFTTRSVRLILPPSGSRDPSPNITWSIP